MNKYFISALLRKLGLIQLMDKSRFYINLIKTYNRRRKFLKENPTIKLPPPYFLYETFNLNYYSFYYNSIGTAKWLLSYFNKYMDLMDVNILDWGCGAGRVIRHIPKFVDESCRFYGTDYNTKYIRWCSENIAGIQFKTNQLKPPMDFQDNSMDIIYGISIFTHLSEEMHYAWFQELMRILKSGGILLITLHGDAFKMKLSEDEKQQFDHGYLVVKAKTKEGHRTFAAYQPKSFVYELIGNNQLQEHVPGIIKNGVPQQDVWVIKKS